MKMKKLLAGVLSAAMVATMIPASMAFSSVSAEGEGNGLVASYDFTKGQTDNWAAYTSTQNGTTGAGNVTWTEGNNAVTITENGLYMPAGMNSYNIANPLKGKVTDGWTIIMDVTIPSTMAGDPEYPQGQTVYEGLLGFNNHAQGGFEYWQVSNNGVAVQANAFAAYNQSGLDNDQWWFGPVAEDITAGNGVVILPKDSQVRYAVSVTQAAVNFYVNGECVKTIPNDTTGIYSGDISLAAANVYDWFTLGAGATGDSWAWWSTAMTVANISFYNTAFTDDEAEAEYIASQLDLEVIGMQAGTINDTSAIRFVANMDSSAVDTNNASIVNVGWAWEMKAATADWGEYQSAQVTTVTSDSSLTSETGKYAYTLVCESDSAEDYYSAVPYVVIEVNGNNYTFCYNGRGASYVSNPSDLVYAPADFAEVSTQA